LKTAFFSSIIVIKNEEFGHQNSSIETDENNRLEGKLKKKETPKP
jgi:hypothetical protein